MIMKNTTISKKSLCVIFILSITTLSYALYAQYFQHYSPCALCILEQIIVSLIIIITLIPLIYKASNLIIKINTMLTILISLVGIKLASYHLFLTNLPINQQPFSCGIPLNILYKQVTLQKFLHEIFNNNRCGIINWKVFGFINPVKAILLFYIIITLISLISLIKNYLYNK